MLLSKQLLCKINLTFSDYEEKLAREAELLLEGRALLEEIRPNLELG